MMNLLAKFEQVQIKTDARISTKDREICETYQAAYEQARTGLASLAAQVSDLEDQEEETVAVILEDQKKCPFYAPSFLSAVKRNDIYKALDETHTTLIRILVSYFNQNYRVSIDESKIFSVLLPQKPKGSYPRSSAEAIEEYIDKMRKLTLRYESMLDCIFDQLGSLSFQEKAVKEIKDAAHEAAWNHYQGQKKYERKKNIIAFSYGCSLYRWRNGTEFEIFDGIKDVIRTLAYFEYEQAGVYGEFEPYFKNWHAVPLTEFSFTKKVKHIKCYKNCKLEIKFTSEAYAKQFAEEYLGTTV